MAKNYESPLTEFLNQYKQKHPDTERRQREGRNLLWDKNLDTELLDNFRAGRVHQRPYVYDTN